MFEKQSIHDFRYNWDLLESMFSSSMESRSFQYFPPSGLKGLDMQMLEFRMLNRRNYWFSVSGPTFQSLPPNDARLRIRFFSFTRFYDHRAAAADTSGTIFAI